MFDITDAELAWLDQEDAHVADMIRQYGVYITYVGGACSAPGCACAEAGESPAFGYTAGLFGIGHPELAITGVSMNTAGQVLNEVAAAVLDGAHLLPGMTLEAASMPRRISVQRVPNPAEIAFTANRHYHRPDHASVPLLQLVYADEKGRFPWDDGCALTPDAQPLPGQWRA